MWLIMWVISNIHIIHWIISGNYLFKSDYISWFSAIYYPTYNDTHTRTQAHTHAHKHTDTQTLKHTNFDTQVCESNAELLSTTTVTI